MKAGEKIKFYESPYFFTEKKWGYEVKKNSQNDPNEQIFPRYLSQKKMLDLGI